MKYLRGSDLVEYISERQSKQVRSLIQSKGTQPTLAIISTNPDHLPSKKYLDLKKERGEELGIKVDIFSISQKEAPQLIGRLAKDPQVHGIILQLPLNEPSETDELIELIPKEKDVDGLTKESLVQPATVGAILWLLAGYNIDLRNKNILIIGQGRLVGLPITIALQDQNLSPKTLDDSNDQKELEAAVKEADVIISAAGSPGLIKSAILKDNQIVIDAGTTEADRVIKGDISQEVYSSSLNIKITPNKGGVGPLTISYLFENLLLLIDNSR